LPGWRGSFSKGAKGRAVPRKPRSGNKTGRPGNRDNEEGYRQDLAAVVLRYWQAVDSGLHAGKGRPPKGQRTAIQEAMLFSWSSLITEHVLKQYIRPIRRPDGTLNSTGSESHKDESGHITVTLRAPSKFKPGIVE
jgi:hypothetical protein